MGLYNYVDFSMTCPVCGGATEAFQTKEQGDAEDVRMHTVALLSIEQCVTQCLSCDTWITLDNANDTIWHMTIERD